MKSAIFGQSHNLIPVPIDRTKVVPVLRQSGTGTHLQNRVGTGIDQSGTGTNASGGIDFCICALISPEFVL